MAQPSAQDYAALLMAQQSASAGQAGGDAQQQLMAAAMAAAAAQGGQQGTPGAAGLPPGTDPAAAAAWQQYYTQYYLWYQQQAMVLAQQEAMARQSASASGIRPNAQGLYTLFVYHLPHSVDNNKLMELFRPYGEVAEAIIMRENPRDQTSPTRGFGFVSFRTYTEASEAMAAMNGYQIEHKRLQVSFKTSKGGPGMK